jgi:hypothetical protein
VISHSQFEILKPKLWPFEKSWIKFPKWFMTVKISNKKTKSSPLQEFNMVLKNSFLGVHFFPWEFSNKIN